MGTATRQRISAAVIALCGLGVVVVGRDSGRIAGVVLLCVAATYLAIAALRHGSGRATASGSKADPESRRKAPH